MSRDEWDDLDDAQLEQRAASEDGATGLLRGIQLLLQELISAVQSSGASGDGGKDKDLSANDQTSSVTAPLSTGGGNLDNTATPNAVKCKSRFSKATAFTVQFGLDTLGVLPRATVTWTLGGNTITRTIDVTTGCMISGVAERVLVSVADKTNLESWAASPASYNVTIVISPTARPDTAVPPVYTAIAAGQLNPGALTTIIPPLGASGLQVNGVSSGAAAQLRVDFYTAGTVGSTAVKIASYEIDAFTPGFIPLIGGVAQVTITNEGGAGQAIVSAVWSIDG